MADISKVYWMASQKALLSKGPNDLAPVKAPIKLQFLHADNATLLMSDSYRAKILAEKVIYSFFIISLLFNISSLSKEKKLFLHLPKTILNENFILYKADYTHV